jgi:dihydropteroate synthase
MYTLNCRGKLLAISKPIVMGIINVTPDSFFKMAGVHRVDDHVELAGKMIREGAAILDIGGQSTRPGSQRLEAGIEIERVVPVLEAIRSQYPDAILSIDTYQARVAEAAVGAGASIVNDISGGGMDPAMIPFVGSARLPFVCTHIKGTPENMQDHASYEDVVKEVLDYFILRIDECKRAGIHDVIIDPGFGFAKTREHNLRLLKALSTFQMTGMPVLAGLSRKATIYKTLGISPGEALNGTTVLNTIALLQGASILRVHDVKEAMEAIELLEAFNRV